MDHTLLIHPFIELTRRQHRVGDKQKEYEESGLAKGIKGASFQVSVIMFDSAAHLLLIGRTIDSASDIHSVIDHACMRIPDFDSDSDSEPDAEALQPSTARQDGGACQGRTATGRGFTGAEALQIGTTYALFSRGFSKISRCSFSGSNCSLLLESNIIVGRFSVSYGSHRGSPLFEVFGLPVVTE